MDIAVVGAVVSALVAAILGLASAVTWLFFQLRAQDAAHNAALEEISRQHATCERKVATLEAQMVALQAMAEQARQYGDAAGPEAEVIVDAASGMIVGWSGGAIFLLHYAPREIFGKPFAKLLPQRHRDYYAGELNEMARSGKAPHFGPLAHHVLTREGTEAAADITLKGWRAGEQCRVGVTLRPRAADSSDGQPPSGVTT